jgi:hypothetical protein
MVREDYLDGHSAWYLPNVEVAAAKSGYRRVIAQNETGQLIDRSRIDTRHGRMMSRLFCHRDPFRSVARWQSR